MPAFNQKIYDTLSPAEQRLYVQYDNALEFTIEQLSEILGNSPSSIYALRCTGKFPIPCYKRGRRLYAKLQHVARYLEERDRQAVEELCEKVGAVMGESQADRLQKLYLPPEP